jgi:CheY-like chemotaxis protein
MTSPHAAPVVLLVEDDEDDRLFFQRALRKARLGWTLATASSGREAIDYLEGSGRFADRGKHPFPSHVLLDLKLPEISGLEVLQWIRNHPGLAGLPVIILSSSREPSDMERAGTLGVDAYEVKPVEFASLVATVRSIARRWRLAEEGAVP